MDTADALHRASLDVLKSAIKASALNQKEVAAAVGIREDTLSKRLSEGYPTYRLDHRDVPRILAVVGMPFDKYSKAVDKLAAELLRDADV